MRVWRTVAGTLLVLFGLTLFPGRYVQAKARPAPPIQTLATRIEKAYPWAKVSFTYATLDHKQYYLALYEVGKGRDLSQGIGAKLMYLYSSILKGQSTYTLTTYVLTTAGAYTDWQYKYNTVTRQLLRLQFGGVRRNILTSWYLTPGEIAQAAKVGHWPKNGVTITT
jgi:hypothetical protein